MYSIMCVTKLKGTFAILYTNIYLSHIHSSSFSTLLLNRQSSFTGSII